MKALVNQSRPEVKSKPLPMHKDPVYLAKLKREFIAAHNERIRKQKLQQS